MSKLYTFELKPEQKIRTAAKQAVRFARKHNAPILFKFDKFTQLLLTPLMEPTDIISMYTSMGHKNLINQDKKSR